MKLIVLSICVVVVAGCASSFPVITEHTQYDLYVGKIVTVRGVVSSTKIPSINGIDVRLGSQDLSGQVAEATGILYRWEVTKEQLDESEKKYGPIAHRGPGIFYRLKALDDSNYDAQVQPMTP